MHSLDMSQQANYKQLQMCWQKTKAESPTVPFHKHANHSLILYHVDCLPAVATALWQFKRDGLLELFHGADGDH